MSLKLIANWEGTEFQTFSDPFDALNPRKNKLFQYGLGNQLTGKHFKALAKSLYTAENIRANKEILLPGLYSYGNGPYCEEAIEKILTQVPEEHHWGLFNYWLQPDGASHWGIAYYASQGPHSYYTDSLVLRVDDFHPTQRTTCNAESWITAVKSHLEKICETWGRDLESELKWNFQNSLAFNHQFFAHLVRLFCNWKLARGQDSNWLTSENLWEALAGNEDNSSGLTPNSRTASFSQLTVIVRVTDRNRAPIHKLLNYSANVFDLLGGPLLDKGEHDPILYGVELECSTDYTVRQLVEAGKNAFLACKQDGSITGNKRYHVEMVTRPMSFKMHRKQWAYFFHQLDYDQFDTSKATNNGMHVHIDRKAFFDDMHLRKFTWFITHPGHFDFIFALSERGNMESFRSYAAVPDFRGLKKGKAFIEAVQQARALRGAVNLQKGPTIEVRLFRGVVSYVSVLKNLEFVDAVLHFSRDQSIKELTIRDFFNWLAKAPSNKYVVLKKFLEEIKAEQFLKKAEVKHVVFNENDAKKILDMINKSGIKIDDEHISILNSYQKHETFVLKDGKIALHPSIVPAHLELSRDMAAKVLRGWL